MEKTASDKPFRIVISGVIIMLMLGAAYVWGIYLEPLMTEFGWSKARASLPFSVFLLSYTVGMILGGRLQDKYGPGMICSIGAVLFGVSYLLSGFANSLIYLCCIYGIVGGIGTGFAYVTPMATVVKWFPHKKGLMGGFVVFGFGAGAFFLSPMVRKIITDFGWRTSFIAFGAVFTAVTFIASKFIKNPPEEWLKDVISKTPTRESLMETDGMATLRTSIFWMAWAVWFFALTVGLGLMGHIVSYATEKGVDPMAAAFCLSIIAIFNGIGRILIGGLSDKIGRTSALAGALFLMATVSFSLHFYADKLALLYILCALFGVSFGTCMVLYPAIAADMFGTKYLGGNYGLLFSSYGLGGFLGPIFFGRVHDLTKEYFLAFIISSLLCLIGGVLALAVRAKGRRIKAQKNLMR